ncbi:MAG: hypothetical protein LBK06_06595 [Planctomycetaceae bacterium]|nr:hypothetical protein [Planctomycetaceae bacterium]
MKCHTATYYSKPTAPTKSKVTTCLAQSLNILAKDAYGLIGQIEVRL